MLIPNEQQDRRSFSEVLADPALHEALRSAGAVLLARSGQPGTLGSALGHALPAGTAAYRAAQEDEAWMAQFADASPALQAVAKSLAPSQRAAFLLSQQPRTEIHRSGDDLVAVTGTESEVVHQGRPSTERPAALRMALELTGLDPGGPIPSDRLEEVRQVITELSRAGANHTTIDLPGEGETAVAGNLRESREAAVTARRNLERVERAMEIAETPEFAKVTGRFSSFREQAAAVGRQLGLNDGAALDLADEYTALLSTLATEELQKFGAGSGLSDTDLAEAKAAVGANRRLTAPALRAILRVVAESQRETVADHNELLRRAGQLGLDPRVIEFNRLGGAGDLLDEFGVVQIRGGGR